MDDAIDKLTKLATELTDRVDVLEKENSALRTQLECQTKQASEKAAVAPAVSEAVVDATLDALVKAGSLNEDQRAESRGILLHDMEAPHKLLQHFLDAQIQTKTASVEDDENVSGGRIVSNSKNRINSKEQAEADCLDRMVRILKM